MLRDFHLEVDVRWSDQAAGEGHAELKVPFTPIGSEVIYSNMAEDICCAMSNILKLYTACLKVLFE